MPSAARVGDTTNHGGTIVGQGASTVLIGGKPAAVAGDTHVCSLPPNSHQPTASVFPPWKRHSSHRGNAGITHNRCLYLRCNGSRWRPYGRY